MKHMFRFVVGAAAAVALLVYATSGYSLIRENPDPLHMITYYVLCVSLLIMLIIVIVNPKAVKEVFIHEFYIRGVSGTSSLLLSIYLLIYSFFGPSGPGPTLLLERILGIFLGFLYLLLFYRLICKLPNPDE